MRNKTSLLSISLLCTALCVTGAWAEQTASGRDGSVVSKPNPLNNLYFGEQHLHTSSSVHGAANPQKKK